jgi:hypothetical protein
MPAMLILMPGNVKQYMRQTIDGQVCACTPTAQTPNIEIALHTIGAHSIARAYTMLLLMTGRTVNDSSKL